VIARALWIALLSSAVALAAGDVVKGRELFRSCQGCHNTASDERKMGPSLRSLFGKVTLRNGKHADDENVREIVLDGFKRHAFVSILVQGRRNRRPDGLSPYAYRQADRYAAPPGVAYFKAYCVSCHSPDSRTLGRSGPEG